MNKIETVKQLWDKHREFIPDDAYPCCVVRVPEALACTSFFPGGYGLHAGNGKVNSGKRLRELPIMILGQDYHNEETYKKRRREGWKYPQRTTLGKLIELMGEAQFNGFHLCFFSNVYMGLRKGNSEATGKFPGTCNPAFVNLCRKFLLRQIQVQQPRLILTLGKPAAMFFAAAADDSDDERDLQSWRKGKKLWDDDHCKPLLSSVRFDEYTVPTAASLIHPSMFNSNAKRRHYDGDTGRDAELKLLRDAIKAAGLSEA